MIAFALRRKQPSCQSHRRPNHQTRCSCTGIWSVPLFLLPNLPNHWSKKKKNLPNPTTEDKYYKEHILNPLIFFLLAWVSELAFRICMTAQKPPPLILGMLHFLFLWLNLQSSRISWIPFSLLCNYLYSTRISTWNHGISEHEIMVMFFLCNSLDLVPDPGTYKAAFFSLLRSTFNVFAKVPHWNYFLYLLMQEYHISIQ